MSAAAKRPQDRSRIVCRMQCNHRRLRIQRTRVSDDRGGRFEVCGYIDQENLRPRSIVYDASSPEMPPPLKFRDITPKDVEEGIDRLRREGRTTI